MLHIFFFVLITHPTDILHERELEHPIQFDLLILKDIPKATLGTVLVDQAEVLRVYARPHKVADVVVVQILHLHFQRFQENDCCKFI